MNQTDACLRAKIMYFVDVGIEVNGDSVVGYRARIARRCRRPAHVGKSAHSG
jgi:hypothetical protein